MIHIRAAGPLDTGPMAGLLNDIILTGGTTAMAKPVTAGDLTGRMAAWRGRNAWFLAEDDAGQVLGFQWIEPNEALPPEACDIATFTRQGRARLGVGSALFERSSAAARQLGYGWINATIRADNAGGLAYYQSRGFETYAIRHNIPMPDGTPIDRISKRFDLR